MTWAVKVDYAKKVAELEQKIEELNALVQRKQEAIVNLEHTVAYVSAQAAIMPSGFEANVYYAEHGLGYTRMPILRQEATPVPGKFQINVLVEPPYPRQQYAPPYYGNGLNAQLPGYQQASQNTVQSGSTGKEWWTRDKLLELKKWYDEETKKRP